MILAKLLLGGILFIALSVRKIITEELDMLRWLLPYFLPIIIGIHYILLGFVWYALITIALMALLFIYGFEKDVGYVLLAACYYDTLWFSGIVFTLMYNIVFVDDRRIILHQYIMYIILITMPYIFNM